MGIELLGQDRRLGGVADGHMGNLQQPSGLVPFARILYRPYLHGCKEIVFRNLSQGLHDRPLSSHDLGEGLEVDQARLHIRIH